MQNHRLLAARLNIVMGWAGVTIASLTIFVILLFFVWALSSSTNLSIRELTTGNLLGVIAILALALAILQLAFSIVQLSGGEKILAGDRRLTGLMIVSIIAILAFPIGTIIGAYTIWVLKTGKHLTEISPETSHPRSEEMAREGITFNGAYYACGEMHFDKLDDALAHANWLRRKNSRA